MAKSAKEARRQRARVRSILAEGGSEYDICEECDVTPSRARALVKEVLGDETSSLLSDSPADTFARYSIIADGLLEDLDEVILAGKGGKDKLGLNAVVAAVRAKHIIATDVLKLGQKLGVVPVEPERDKQIGGVSTRAMQTEALRSHVAKSRQKLLSDIEAAGGRKYVDEPDGDLYQDDLSDDSEPSPANPPSQSPAKSGRVTRKRA